MDIEIKVPSLGESESEATLVAWHKQPGDEVVEDEIVAEVESDKITMEIPAIATGVLKEARKQEGDVVQAGEVIGIIEERQAPAKPSGKTPAKAGGKATAPKAEEPAPEEPAAESPRPAAAEAAKAAHRAEPATSAAAGPAETSSEAEPRGGPKVAAVPEPSPAPEGPAAAVAGERERRVPMSALRKTIARRLKEAQNTAAILTTFNEVNMQPVLDLRARYREAFKARHGVDLGLMSFFVRACIEALGRFPVVNACVEGEDIVYRNYYDIGIAVSTERGLVVPVLRDAGAMSMAVIEERIADFAKRAREGGLLPDDLKGGTFSITNGGVFGSLLSTPILNPPQSAILGMHAIQKRPVAEGDRVVVRPMMYVALSYDHRIIDGREAVRFLVAVKEALEYPGRMMLDL